MAQAALKMVRDAIAPRKRRTFEDFPEWVAACARLREIANEYNSVDERLKGVTGTIAELARRRTASIDDAVNARLANLPQPIAVLVEDREQLEVDLRIIRGVLARQSDIVHEIEGRCANEILQEARPTHERLLRDTRAAVLALSDALDAEQDFILGLVKDRVSVNSLPSVPQRIRQAVGSRRRWASGSNEADRIISEYLGEPWDHSRVTM
jgi:hypothetical protein